MGAVFFLIGMIALLGFGLFVSTGGMIGTILSIVYKHKVLRGISITLLVVGILIIAVPILLVGGILYLNTIPPRNFVDTGIVIEGDIYQDDYFTADGITYRELDLEANDYVCSEIGTPVFSYMPDGILNRSQWRNFYRLETEYEFDLIWDGYWSLYCPEQQFSTVTQYYANCAHTWFLSQDRTQIPLSADAAQAIDDYLTLSNPSPVVRIQESMVSEISVWQYSADGIVYLGLIDFVITETGLYEVYEVSYDTDTPTYTGCRVPDDLAGPLLAEFSAISDWR